MRCAMNGFNGGFMNKTIYRGYGIELLDNFCGLLRITRPSGKFISLSTSFKNASKIIDQDIQQLLKGV